jgi:hypothetical protein
MKPFFDLSRITGWPLKTILLSLVFVAAGCGKSNTSAPVVTPAQSPVATTTPAPISTAPAMSPQPAAQAAPDDSKQSLQLLNRALIRWMIKNRRHPQNFDDFASSANFQIPNPPTGKKYALDSRGFIILADNSTQ